MADAGSVDVGHTDVNRIKASMPSEGVNFFSRNLSIESGINSVRSKRSNTLTILLAKDGKATVTE